MLNNDVFIFDNVVHMYDMSDDNLLSPASATDRLGHLKIGAGSGAAIPGRSPNPISSRPRRGWATGTHADGKAKISDRCCSPMD